MTTKHDKIELSAQLLTVMGSKVRQIRDSGFIPAVLYGKEIASENLWIKELDLKRLLKAKSIPIITLRQKKYLIFEGKV